MQHAEQTGVIPVHHRWEPGGGAPNLRWPWGSGGKAPSLWAIFAIFSEKIAIFVPLGSNFAPFWSHLKELTCKDLKAS